MSWKQYAEPYYSSSDLTGSLITQKTIFNQKSLIRYIRTWIIFFNSPTFTNLKLKIYAYQSGEKGKLLYTSTNSWQPSDVYTLAYATKELYFTFDDISLHDTNPYLLALSADSASFSESSFIAWVKGWPDPVYTTNVTTTLVSQNANPFQISTVGAAL